MVADGRLFTLGITGVLDLGCRSGRLAWRKTFETAHRDGTAFGFTAASPVVDGDRLIAFVGSDNDGALAAFDVKTGSELWAWKARPSTPRPSSRPGTACGRW